MKREEIELDDIEDEPPHGDEKKNDYGDAERLVMIVAATFLVAAVNALLFGLKGFIVTVLLYIAIAARSSIVYILLPFIPLTGDMAFLILLVTAASLYFIAGIELLTSVLAAIVVVLVVATFQVIDSGKIQNGK